MSVFRARSVLSVSVLLCQAQPCIGQTGLADAISVVASQWRLGSFTRFGDWLGEPEAFQTDSVAIGLAAVVYYIEYGQPGSHSAPPWYSVGKTGSMLHRLRGFTSPELVSFARAAGLLGRDSTIAVQTAMILVGALSGDPQRSAIFPDRTPPSPRDDRVLHAWRDARKEGILDTLWFGPLLGERRFAVELATGRLYIRIVALEPVGERVWREQRWAFSFNADGQLDDWVVIDAGQFITSQ